MEPLVGQLLPLLLLGAVFYFLLIRPQRARAQQQRALLSALGTGDRVVTIGGLHGTIASVDEDTLRVEIAPGTVVTLVKGAIARRILDADDDAGDGTSGGATAAGD